MDEVKEIKTNCLNNPERMLWDKTKNIEEVRNIFYYIKGLKYQDMPDYQRIKGQLISIYERNQPIYMQPKEHLLFNQRTQALNNT